MHHEMDRDRGKEIVVVWYDENCEELISFSIRTAFNYKEKLIRIYEPEKAQY